MTTFNAQPASSGFWGVCNIETGFMVQSAMFTRPEAVWLAEYHEANPLTQPVAAVAALADYMKANVITVSKPEPAALPDPYAGKLFMLNTLTGQVESCDPLRWDTYPLHWRQIDRVTFDNILAAPSYAEAAIAEIKRRDETYQQALIVRPAAEAVDGLTAALNGLPPARPVAAGRADLVTAVRNLFSRSGQVDEMALFHFILDVLGDQKPPTSPDPQPLIEALEAIADGYTGDTTPGYVAQQGLEAYKLGQKLTVGGE